MKLLYVFNARIPTEKAHGVQIMKMCEAFAGHGLNVELVVPRRVQTAQMRQVKSLWEYYGICQRFRLTRLPSLDFLFLDPHLPSWLVYLPFYVQALTFHVCAVFYSLLRQGEVLYSREWVFFLFWLPWRWLRKRTLVLEEHTFPHRGGWGARLHLAVSRRMDRLVVVTHQLKERFVEAGVPVGRILVAPDGVDLERFTALPLRREARRQLGLPLDRCIVGYVGRFHTLGMSKGLDLLVRAVGDLCNQGQTDVTLCLVGGPLEVAGEYRELAIRERLAADSLILVGHVPPSKVPFYMRAFDVCAMPFPWTEHYAYYMSPLKMFEYMASGTPIVATDLPSVQEVLRDGENAVLVEPDSSEALAQGIQRVLYDPVLAGRIGEQARMDVWRYDWHRRAKSIIGLVAA